VPITAKELRAGAAEVFATKLFLGLLYVHTVFHCGTFRNRGWFRSASDSDFVVLLHEGTKKFKPNKEIGGSGCGARRSLGRTPESGHD
jgi:hypothetical protein